MYRRVSAPAEYDASWLDRELEQIERTFNETDLLRLVLKNTPPDKPREGQVEFASGFPNWDPPGDGVNAGDNKGLYLYKNAAWELIPTQTNGTWTPTFTFATPGNVSTVYNFQQGVWIRTGRSVQIYFDLQGTITHTTAAGELQVPGIPFTPRGGGNLGIRGTLRWSGINKLGGFTQIAPAQTAGTQFLNFGAYGMNLAAQSVSAPDVPSGGIMRLAGGLQYLI